MFIVERPAWNVTVPTQLAFYSQTEIPLIDRPYYFDFLHTVSDDEIDRQGHVNNLRYIHWTLGAASAHSKACGWTDQRRSESGCDWVVRSHNITYKSSAFAGDEIVVRTWVADMQRVASRRGYLIFRPSDQTLVARAETKWAFVSLTERKVVRIPDDMAAAFQITESAPPLPWK